MSLDNTHKNTLEASEISNDNNETGNKETVTFTLDEEYLKKIINELYVEDT
ncbi:12163_t:CDS:1, partial [Funneliformis mosseae]